MERQWMATVEIPTEGGEPVVLEFGPATREKLLLRFADELPAHALEGEHVFDGAEWRFSYRPAD